MASDVVNIGDIVEQINKYDEEKDRAKGGVKKALFGLAASSLTFVAIHLSDLRQLAQNSGLFDEVLFLISQYSTGVASAGFGVALIWVLFKKAGLDIRIDELENLLKSKSDSGSKMKGKAK